MDKTLLVEYVMVLDDLPDYKSSVKYETPVSMSQCLWLGDRPNCCFPEKDCCWLRLKFGQPLWKSSSESIKMASTQDIETSVITNNSHSHEYTNSDDQPTTNNSV